MALEKEILCFRSDLFDVVNDVKISLLEDQEDDVSSASPQRRVPQERSLQAGDDSFQSLDVTTLYISFYKLVEEEKMGKRGKIGGGVKEWRAARAS